MSRSMATRGPYISTPVWIGDYLGRDQLIPGGSVVDPALFAADASGKKFIPSGTLLGRTTAEKVADLPFGPFAAGDQDSYLLVHSVRDAADIPDVDLLRPNTVVKVNFLPGYATLTADALTAIHSRYNTTMGVD